MTDPGASAMACPRCRAPLQNVDGVTRRCVKDRLVFHRVDGIWRMLLPDREVYYAPFIRDYETIRQAEGRGSVEPEYYRTLPYHPAADWKIRAQSFDALLAHVITPMEDKGYPLQILDLGAGNSWLSNRLAARGHDVTAVDLTINSFDGLGCYRFYASTFLSVQAEFDYLPIPDHAAAIIIFNASLHYSVNIEQTLKAVLRVLNDAGLIIILDTPVYHDAGSGMQMVAERQSQFTQRYGFASNNLHSENFLTYGRLGEIAVALRLQWKLITPFYNLQWSLSPTLARLRHRREPARFHIMVLSRE
jgi:SAM-dependent methyltransferase